jgi:hypothetical protein
VFCRMEAEAVLINIGWWRKIVSLVFWKTFFHIKTSRWSRRKSRLNGKIFIANG